MSYLLDMPMTKYRAQQALESQSQENSHANRYVVPHELGILYNKVNKIAKTSFSYPKIYYAFQEQIFTNINKILSEMVIGRSHS